MKSFSAMRGISPPGPILYSSHRSLGRAQIERPAHVVTRSLRRMHLNARGLLDERKRIHFAGAEVEVHLAAFGVRVHEVIRGRRRAAEPAHVLHAARRAA